MYLRLMSASYCGSQFRAQLTRLMEVKQTKTAANVSRDIQGCSVLITLFSRKANSTDQLAMKHSGPSWGFHFAKIPTTITEKKKNWNCLEISIQRRKINNDWPLRCFATNRAATINTHRKSDLPIYAANWQCCCEDSLISFF